MRFQLQFDMDNAAFEEPGLEAARILRHVADGVELDAKEGNCTDFNGNKVGQWKITGRQP